MDLKGHDAWKTTDPADRELGRATGRPVPYRCLSCDWRGKGSLDRSVHFYATGHKLIVPKGDPRYDQDSPEPDGETFRGGEAAAFEREEMARIQRELK